VGIVGRTLQLAQSKQRVRQIDMNEYIAKKEFQQPKQDEVGLIELSGHVVVIEKLGIQPVLLRHSLAQLVGPYK
jgi:hypothetical protein